MRGVVGFGVGAAEEGEDRRGAAGRPYVSGKTADAVLRANTFAGVGGFGEGLWGGTGGRGTGDGGRGGVRDLGSVCRFWGGLGRGAFGGAIGSLVHSGRWGWLTRDSGPGGSTPVSGVPLVDFRGDSRFGKRAHGRIASVVLPINMERLERDGPRQGIRRPSRPGHLFEHPSRPAFEPHAATF